MAGLIYGEETHFEIKNFELQSLSYKPVHAVRLSLKDRKDRRLTGKRVALNVWRALQ